MPRTDPYGTPFSDLLLSNEFLISNSNSILEVTDNNVNYIRVNLIILKNISMMIAVEGSFGVKGDVITAEQRSNKAL